MHQCPVCPKSFPSPYKLQRHYVTHTGQKPFTCTSCGKAFTQSDHLKTHLQKVHRSRQANGDPAAGVNTHGRGNYTVMPSIVSSPVASHTEWKKKMVAHKVFLPSFETGNPPKSTHVNNAAVTQSCISNVMIPKLEKQVDSANVDASGCKSDSVYTCEICLKSFTSPLHLWIHTPTHSKQKQLKRGRESGQTFSKQASARGKLQSQELSSSRSKVTLKNQCSKCLKAFCSPSKLERHSLIHTGQKPYSCVICRKAFRQKVHLNSHLRVSKKCSLSASTEGKKQGFCNSRQTSGLQPQSSLRPTSHRAPVNSSVGLELQCKISVKTEITSDAVEKQEQSSDTSSQCWRVCPKLDEQEQQNQNELGSPTTVQNSNNVRISDSEAMTHLPEPSHADLSDLNIIVKPEPWSGNDSDGDDSPPQDSEFLPPAGQQREACHATSKKQRMNSLHQCQTCLKCFPYASKLQRHVRTHTGQRPFGCEMCGKTFRQETHLRVHSRTHLWSRYHKQRSLYINWPSRTAADVPVQEMLPYKKGFETQTGSDVTSVKHLDHTPSRLLPHSSKKNEVQNVSAVTVKRTQIAKFMRNPGNLQHKCFQCLKCFPSASKLQRHEMVHTGMKPFQCVFCGKAFRQAPHLKNHERTHWEAKPPKPVKQQGNIRKLKPNSQQQLSPRTSTRIAQRKKSANTDATLSNRGGDGGSGVSVLLCTRREIASKVKREGNFMTKSNLTCKKRKHTCQICFKSFTFPYMLSRHLVVHSGIRPYKCTLCSKTFTQRGHLRIHERECRQDNRISHCIPREMINTSFLQDKCYENLSDCADLNVDATGEQQESRYTSVGHLSFIDGDLPSCSDSGWLAEPDVEQRDVCNQTMSNYDQATEHYYSFPSKLAFEICKLAQNENMTLSHHYEDNAHNVEAPCQPKGVISDSIQLLGDELVSSVVEDETQPDDYWCEPLTVFECDKCSVSFESKTDLEQHTCLTNVRPKSESALKYCCNICFKHFVTPSKLKRHYLTHTGQRPFRCDICGKAFTQSAHVRTHRLTH